MKGRRELLGPARVKRGTVERSSEGERRERETLAFAGECPHAVLDASAGETSLGQERAAVHFDGKI